MPPVSGYQYYTCMPPVSGYQAAPFVVPFSNLGAPSLQGSPKYILNIEKQVRHVLHEINRWIFNFLISNYGRRGEGEERESQPVNIEVMEKAIAVRFLLFSHTVDENIIATIKMRKIFFTL